MLRLVWVRLALLLANVCMGLNGRVREAFLTVVTIIVLIVKFISSY